MGTQQDVKDARGNKDGQNGIYQKCNGNYMDYS
jgi:hypothetical protein